MIFQSIHNATKVEVGKCNCVNGETYCQELTVKTREGLEFQLTIFTEDKTVLSALKQTKTY